MPKAVASSRLRSVRNLLFVTLGVFAVHSCASGPAPSLTADELLTAPYTYKAGQPFDVDAFLGALPDWLTTAYDGASFDAARGAMVINGLQFGIAGAPEMRIVADRAVIWGADIGAMEAVFSGTAYNAAKAGLFERLMLEGVRSEGMQWAGGEENAGLSVAKVVIDGFSARSFNLAPKAGVGEEVKFLRSVAATLGSFAFDAAAYADLRLRLANNQGERAELNIGQAFARGYDAGAVEFQSAIGFGAFIQGAGGDAPVEVSGAVAPEKAAGPYAKILNKPPSQAISQVLRSPAAMLAAAAGGAATAYEADYLETRGADFAGGLRWLARWELPPITETELIDFGAQTMLGYREFWDGRAVSTIETSEVQSADFYWLIPSHYAVKYTGMAYNLGAMIDAMQARMEAGAATEAAPQFLQMRETLAGFGVEQLTGDAAFSWRWNGETGDAALASSAALADIADNDVVISFGGPGLAEWNAMVRDDTPAAVATQAMTLKGFRFGLADNGFLDDVFGYIAAEQGGGVTGAQMRQSLAAMLHLTGAQAAAANPRVADYSNAFVGFITKGGRIDIVAAPPAPVAFGTLQSVGEAAPNTLSDLLNITVTHTE